MYMKFGSVIVTVLCSVALSSQASAAARPMLARDALVGKWKATITPDDGGNGKEFTDNLEFKSGKFTSESEKTDGFEPATYEDDPAPQGMGASKFEATLTSKSGDTAKWSGTVAGGEMSGTLVVTKKNGNSISYSVKATRH